MVNKKMKNITKILSSTFIVACVFTFGASMSAIKANAQVVSTECQLITNLLSSQSRIDNLISTGVFTVEQIQALRDRCIATSTIPTLITMNSTYSGFSNFPKAFFASSSIPIIDVLHGTDMQYLSLKDMHNGLTPYDFTKIEYEEDVNGATTPTGIKLGKYTSPSLNNGHYSWAVMAHEQGHNFFGGTSSFYNTVAAGQPFLQESLAVLSAQYSQNYIISSNSTQLTSQVLADMSYAFAVERKYQEDMYNRYVNDGRKFSISDVLTSQALDYKMIKYAETYGWDKIKTLSKAFEQSNESKFTFQKDGVTAEEQSTYIVAALSVSFGKDLRSDFINLNFPINNNLYDIIIQNLSPTSTQPSITVISPNGGETWQVGTNRNIKWNSLNFSTSSTVYIELRPKNFNAGSVFKIATPFAVDRYYNWPIPKNITSGQYVIELYKADQNGNINLNESAKDVSDNYFTISDVSTLTASCFATPSIANTGDMVNWTVKVSGGNGYNFNWSGTDGLAGTGPGVSKVYNTSGTKMASVIVTSGSEKAIVSCSIPIVSSNSFPVSANTAAKCDQGIDISWANINTTEYWIARNDVKSDFEILKYDLSLSAKLNNNYRDITAPAGTTQYYRVWYKDAAGKWIGSVIVSAVSAPKCEVIKPPVNTISTSTPIVVSSLNMSGVWNHSFNWDGGGDAAKTTLSQNGSSYSGTSISTIDGTKYEIEGSISGNNIKEKWSTDGYTAYLIGTINSDGSSYSGNFTDTIGNQNGTFTGKKTALSSNSAAILTAWESFIKLFQPTF
jgi:hypothetical protein